MSPNLLPERHNPASKAWPALCLLAGFVWIAPVAADPMSEAGWESFTLAKPIAEPASAAGQTFPSSEDVLLQEFLPPGESLALDVGLGHLQGEDWGGDFVASGSILGIQTHASLALTQGQRGLQLENSRLSLFDSRLGLGLEAGDLCLELHGCGRGARASWKTGRLLSFLAFSLGRNQPGGDSAVLDYRAEITPMSGAAFGVDLSSKGASSAWASYQKGRFSAQIHERGDWLRGSAGPGASLDLGAGYRIGRGIQLQTSFQKSLERGDPSNVQDLSISLPLAPSWSLTLGHRRSRTGLGLSRIDSAAMLLPVGAAHLFVRYQNQRSESFFEGLGGSGSRVPSVQQELLASFYAWSGRSLNLNLESALVWGKSSRLQHRERLVGSWSLSERVRVEASAGLSGQGKLEAPRVRLHLDLSSAAWLDAEYGSLASFQGVPLNPDQKQLKMTLHKQFKVQTPGGGARLRGHVLDTLGQPLPGVLVRVGQFSTRTDSKGSYAFKNMASGGYEVSLEERSLPANVGAAPRQKLELVGRADRALDFFVEPLDTARGWIYLDRNGNGLRDPGEGVPNILVSLDGGRSVSGPDGAFAFYNLRPGSHSIRLEPERLPKQYRLRSPAEVQVSVRPRQMPAAAEFRLEEKKMEILFQETE